ncbi:MAG: hypothetical protein KatS3mg119_0437 [Rhodothalassiaceae bacterium]|nr:MAG: hypothetical protein KatS3mg119_0437 [Rhodothalassiaceae bacterium]
MADRNRGLPACAAIVLLALLPAACGRASPPPRPAPQPAAAPAPPPAGEEARQEWLDSVFGEDRTVSDGIAPPRREPDRGDAKPAPAPAAEPQGGA